jgi:D-3-phosphoglycerate dehydrogenase
MNISILDDYQDTVKTLACYTKVAGHTVRIWNDHTKDIDVLADRLKDTEVLALIRERTRISAALLERLPLLRIISQIGTIPNIDLDACTRQGVIVSSLMDPDRPSYATAELTWGLIIAALRRIPQEIVALKSGKWQAFPIGTGLRGKTLGIFGYGKIGKVIAGYGKAFGMNILVWGRESTLSKAQYDGCSIANNKSQLFEKSDVLTLLVRLLPSTRGMVTASDLSLMKCSALLVNTAREELIAPGALEAALRNGRPGMAAVDVYDKEPLPKGYPLLEMDNVICTPHLGYVERDGLEHMFSVICDQILAYAIGKPINVVNAEVLDKLGFRWR